jgi:hypothetical protein
MNDRVNYHIRDEAGLSFLDMGLSIAHICVS